ncbi:MAG: thioesterase family protein [Alphaproteobacteria bacterium]
MEIAAPLALYHESVRPEWIDVNGHMNVAYYVLAFDHATDAFYAYLGLTEDYIHRRNQSYFMLESHLTYQREMRAGDRMRFTTQLLAFDRKRIHFFHRMSHAEEGYLAATAEWLAIHVDLVERRSAPMPEPVIELLGAIREAHASLPPPPEAGRVIRLNREPAKGPS